MDEYEDLSTYNGDTEHDMYVDYDYNINPEVNCPNISRIATSTNISQLKRLELI